MRTLLILCTFLFAHAANSATFERGGDESLNCVMTISGEIVVGDAVRFRAALADLVVDLGVDSPPGRGEYRLCLNSQGGVLTEAIEMADTLVFGYRVEQDIAGPVFEQDVGDLFSWEFVAGLGTAVPPDGVCESACAVLFMAGGYFSHVGWQENWREPDRVLHVSGRLGFHAPDLVVEGGLYTAESVNSAFRVSVEITEQLTARLRSYRFPPSLFQRVMATARPDIYFVDTIAEAASWDIAIAGAVRPASPTEQNLARVCQNMVTHSQTALTYDEMHYDTNVPANIAADAPGIWVGRYSDRLGHRSHNFEGSGQSITDALNSEGELFVVGRGDGACHLQAPGRGSGPLWRADRLIATDLGLIPREMDVDTFETAMLPGYLTFDDLLELGEDYPSGNLPRDLLLRPIAESVQGFCVLYEDNQLVDQWLCDAEHESRLRVDNTGATNTLVVAWTTDEELIFPLDDSPGAPETELQLLGGLATGSQYFGESFVADSIFSVAELASTLNVCGRASNGGIHCFVPISFTPSEIPWYTR